MLNARALVGSHDIIFITLDTLRYDVAEREARNDGTPNLAALLPNGQWERRHTPGSFTYAAHHAFFAGFLPTPSAAGRHARLFAARFAGSETSTDQTFVFDAPDIVTGLAAQGYRTICIGGVGFFNKQTPLSCVFPSLFHESYWEPRLGVTEPRSTEYQVELAKQILAATPNEQRLFLFMNISALHQPNRFYLPGAQDDTIESHAAALRYVDSQLAPLFEAVQQRHSSLLIICSDHGTAYGEDGYSGHRLAHPSVWEVPYAELVLEKRL
jgi:arylsulfatase A-like enzyme